MKTKWIPMFLAAGLLMATPLSFQSADAVVAATEAKMPASIENLMDIAPEHQFTLREGSKRSEVKLLQWILNDYGLKTAVDGSFGPETKRNGRKFQADKGLIVDGIVGKQTWTAIYGEYR